MSAISRFLGGSPLAVIIKLFVVSALVGLVMSYFDWSPWDVLYGIREFFVGLYHMGFGALDSVIGYVLLGAVIVVPAFLIIRLFSLRR